MGGGLDRTPFACWKQSYQRPLPQGVWKKRGDEKQGELSVVAAERRGVLRGPRGGCPGSGGEKGLNSETKAGQTDAATLAFLWVRFLVDDPGDSDY